MNTQLSTNTSSKNQNVPITSENHSDFRNLITHFWNMVDFPHHAELNEMEPKIEVTENRKEITVSAEVPGITPENLDVEISSDGYLTISGERKNQNEQNSKGGYFSELSYGMFKRTIPLPWDLEFNRADAEYDNGMLSISIPKSATEQTKKKKLNVNKGRKNQ